MTTFKFTPESLVTSLKGVRYSPNVSEGTWSWLLQLSDAVCTVVMKTFSALHGNKGSSHWALPSVCATAGRLWRHQRKSSRASEGWARQEVMTEAAFPYIFHTWNRNRPLIRATHKTVVATGSHMVKQRYVPSRGTSMYHNFWFESCGLNNDAANLWVFTG